MSFFSFLRKKEVVPKNFLFDLGLKTIKELETDEGINASSREEQYACTFGRDSLITSLFLLKVFKKTNDKSLLLLVRKALATLSKLQGKETNIESGEEPGKCIHEFRRSGHEHLTGREKMPWYLYPDGTMRNFDSVDSTPLFLICIYRFYQASGDKNFLKEMDGSIRLALNWLLKYSDSPLDKDDFADFKLSPERKSGGLRNQGWMDSVSSVFHEDASEVAYPLNLAEVQAYAYLALRLWSGHFSSLGENELGEKLSYKADNLKKEFNSKFVSEIGGKPFIASAVDGVGKPILSARSVIGHLLWSSLNTKDDGISDSILYDEYIPYAVKRLLENDLFEPKAGIRTLSLKSSHFKAVSYHNGSIWPHDTMICALGMENFGYGAEADKVKKALRFAFMHFKTPLELFAYEKGKYKEYISSSGIRACQKQAWSAGAMMLLD